MELNMRVDLRKKDIDTLRAIFERFQSIRSVRVFGSRATGGARHTSDIDIAVSAPDMTDGGWSDLCETLDEAPLIYGLDVVRIETLTDKKLNARIDSDGIVIYTGE
jgi:predicted nucleotidyltransferase